MDIVFPIEIQDLRRASSVHTIFVKWFTSIKDIKDQLNKKCHCMPSKMHLFHTSRARALPNHTTLHDLGISKEGHVLRLVIDMISKSYVLMPSQDIKLDGYCTELIKEVQLGLDNGKVPSKTDVLDCTGGVYFMKATNGSHVAVFKPSDEEQGMPNNNKGHAGNEEMGNGLRPYFKPGHGYIRETAVYMLDEGNFCQVPPTTIAHCEHSVFNFPTNAGNGIRHTLNTPEKLNKSFECLFPKLGSLQAFIRASESFEDIGPALISTFELQKIALLDIRMLNCDRNSSNILAVRKPQGNSSRSRRNSRSFSIGSQYEEHSQEEIEIFPFSDDDDVRQSKSTSSFTDTFELIPIDHGYCLPTRLRIDDFDWAWFHYPQLKKDVDPEIVAYVMSINIEDQIAKLTSQLTLPDDSLFLFRIAHILLCEGIKKGLNLKDIASLIARTQDDVPSQLEAAISFAEENAHRAIETRSGRLDARKTASEIISLQESQRDVFNTAYSPSMRKHASIASALHEFHGNSAFASKATTPGGAKSPKMTSADTSMTATQRRKAFKNRSCVESEPILENSSSSTSDDDCRGSEPQIAKCGSTGDISSSMSNSPSHSKKARMDQRFASRRVDSSTVLQKNTITEDDPNNDEYFISDINNQCDSNDEFESSYDIACPDRAQPAFVKVGLSSAGTNFLEGAPLRTLQTMDSASNGPFLGSYLESGLREIGHSSQHFSRPVTENQGAKNHSQPILVPFSGENDVTSSEYNSSNDYGSPKSASYQQALPNTYSSDALSVMSQSASVTPQPREDRANGSSVNTTASERSVSFSPIEKPLKKILKLNTSISNIAAIDSLSGGHSSKLSPGPFPSLKRENAIVQKEFSTPSKTVEAAAVVNKPRACSSGDEEHRSNDSNEDEEEDVYHPQLSKHIVPTVYAKQLSDLSIAATSSCKINGNGGASTSSRSSSGKSSLDQAIGLTRVVSLGAFASPPIYDTEKSERQVPRLRNKRRTVAKTQEFQKLRLEFATKAVASLVTRKRKSQLS
eukprot:gene22974-31280_t